MIENQLVIFGGRMKLVIPSMEQKSQFLDFYYDLADNDPDNADYYSLANESFSRYLNSLEDEEKGLNLRPQHVPCSHRWLVDSSSRIVGVIRIRHNISTPILENFCGHIGYDVAPSYRNLGYATLMLGLALKEASRLAIDKVLISADEDNFPSRKVIERNGGMLDAIVYSTEFESNIARYWVHT